jgi:hypothetical protein
VRPASTVGAAREAIKRRAAGTGGVHRRLAPRQLAAQTPGDRSPCARDGRVVEHDGPRPQAAKSFFSVVQDYAASTRTRARIRGTQIEAGVSEWSLQVSGSRGTVASAAFRKVSTSPRSATTRPVQHLCLHASTANFRHDREVAQAALAELGEIVNFIGGQPGPRQVLSTETSALFESPGRHGAAPLRSTTLELWDAIRCPSRSKPTWRFER